MRIVALLCLFALLVMAFAAPVHRHDPGHEGNCLACHATEHANTIDIDNEAGKPFRVQVQALSVAPVLASLSQPPLFARSPRAPPVSAS